MNLAEQLKQINATIDAKYAEMEKITTKASKEKRLADEDEEKQITELESDIEALEKNKARIEKMLERAKQAEKNATPVAGATNEQGQKTADGDPNPTNITVTENIGKGISFAQYVKAKSLSMRMARKGHFVSPLDIAKSKGMHSNVVQALEKAVVLDTQNSSELVTPHHLSNEFIELLRAKTIVDKLAPHMRHAPFNATISGMATGGAAQWVGEGEAKPVTNPTFNSIELKHHKLAGIVVMTDELLHLSTPSADKMVLDDLIEATKKLVDETFIDDQAQTTTRPAGILNGATKISATGFELNNVKDDLAKLRLAFITQNMSLSGAFYIMSETRACMFAELTDALGNPFFRDMQHGINQKSLNGIPIIESETAGDKIILVKPSEIYLADDGDVQIDTSNEATITINGTQHHLFQENEFAIRVERCMTWAKRRLIASAYISYE